jgi:hypothetical protein
LRQSYIVPKKWIFTNSNKRLWGIKLLETLHLVDKKQPAKLHMRDRALLALYERISGPVTTISGGKNHRFILCWQIVIIYFIKKLLFFLTRRADFLGFFVMISKNFFQARKSKKFC